MPCAALGLASFRPDRDCATTPLKEAEHRYLLSNGKKLRYSRDHRRHPLIAKQILKHYCKKKVEIIEIF